jgi:low affinity Fe/Cu permease
MKNLIQNFETSMEGFATVLSDSLSSMTMFIVITILVIVPIFFVQPVGVVGWIQYVVSVFFQGVALPVLGYIAKISGSRTDAIIAKIESLSEQIAQNTINIEKMTEKIHEDVDSIIEDVEDIEYEVTDKNSEVDTKKN